MHFIRMNILHISINETQLMEQRIFASMLVLIKCYDNKMVKSPYNCVIYPLTQPQVGNQQKMNTLYHLKTG